MHFENVLHQSCLRCQCAQIAKPLRSLLRELSEREGPLTLKTLAVKGTDLISIGVPAGPAVGQTLNALLAKVIAGELPNERYALLEAAGQM